MTNPIKLPAISKIKSLVELDFDRGLIFWKPRPHDHLSGQKLAAAKCWNTRYSGKQAFSTSRNGYKTGSIDNTVYQAHRILWACWIGRDFSEFIDHINGNRCDNRISNLRAVSRKENSRNVCLRSDNKSGIVGVSFYKTRKLWRARIRTPQGHNKTIGYYASKQEAAQARAVESRKMGYHKNHGRRKVLPNALD